MRRRLGLWAIFALAGALPGGAWALSGTFLNNTGTALADATVSLVNAAKQTATDNAGHFAFAGLSSGVTSRTVLGEPALTGNRISFTATAATQASVSLYAIDGSLIAHKEALVPAGTQSIDLPDAGGRHQFAIVRFSAGGKARSFRCLLGEGIASKSGSSSSASPFLLASGLSASTARTAAKDSAVDTLVVSKTTGDVTSTRKLLVWSYADSVNTYLSDGKQILIIDPSNDNDGDGISNYDERYRYHTNAELFDTDGDGVDDYTEIKNGTDPLVADIPDFSFAMTNYPVIVANYSKTVGSESNKTISSGGEYSNSSTFSEQSQATASAEEAIELGIESTEGAEVGTETKATASFTESFKSTTTFGFSVSQTLGAEWSKTASSNWDEAQSTTSSAGETISGGDIKVKIKFTNHSDVAFTIQNPHVSLSATGYDLSTLSTQIGDLTTTDGAITLPSKGTASAIFSATINNANLIEKLAYYSTSLVAQLSNYEIVISGTTTDTMMTNVYRRTTLVTIDPGWYAKDASVKKKHIAKRSIYNDFYTSLLDRYQGNTLYGILAAAKDTPTLDSTKGRFGIFSIRGLKNGEYRGSWGVIVQKTNDSVSIYSPSIISYDPRRISVDTTAYVTVVYSADQDSDGLSGRIEAALGTSDLNRDSDSDGISDSAECAGWKRSGGTTTWVTDPRLKDTDGDGISDLIDPDPLTAEATPTDSTVILTSLLISPLQGSSWSPSSLSSGKNDTLAVNSILRGTSKISLTFKHPVKKIFLSVDGGDSVVTDVASSTGADSSVTYTLNIPLAIGSNAFNVTIYSKSGTYRKQLRLTGIQRRLARSVTSEAITVEKPALNLQGKAANITMSLSKIKAKDSLVSGVYLFRTRTFAVPVVSSDSAKIRQADNLGDSGNATKSLSVGNIVVGLDGQNNQYTLVHVFTDDQTFTDSTLGRDSDYVYFPYVFNSTKTYLTAPSTEGAYYIPNRDITIDSVVLSEKCLYGWLGSSSWNTIMRAYVVVNGDTTYSDKNLWLNNGDSTSLKIPASGNIADRASIKFPYIYSQFVRLDVSTWKDDAILPFFLETPYITHPSGTIAGATNQNWTGDGTQWTYVTSDGPAAAGGHDYFRNHLRIYWHYQAN